MRTRRSLRNQMILWRALGSHMKPEDQNLQREYVREKQREEWREHLARVAAREAGGR